MTTSRPNSDGDWTDSERPRMVPGDQPGDYGVASPDAWPNRRGSGDDCAPDPGNVEDIEQLVGPLDDDDDVHDRIAAVNVDQIPPQQGTDG